MVTKFEGWHKHGLEQETAVPGPQLHVVLTIFLLEALRQHISW